jgi:outer membrane protein assembly factor BamB
MKLFNIVLTALIFVILSGLCYLANPHFYEFNLDYSQIHSRPSLFPSTQYKKLDSSCVATAQYRYDVHRTGLAPQNSTPASQIKIIKHIPFLNSDIHDASKATPIVDETGVYVGTDSGWFLKMNHEGEVIWRFYIPGSLNGIHGSATLDDKKVYIGAYNGIMYSLEKETGDLIWATPVGDFIGASPLLADHGLFISIETSMPDGLVARLDCNSGDIEWVSSWLGGHSHSSPAYDEKSDLIFVGANSGRFFAIKAKAGGTFWEKQFHGQNKGTPMIFEDKVYFASWDKSYHALNIQTGDEVWNQFMGGRIQTSLSLAPELKMGITNTKMGDIAALDLNTGEILWRLRHGDGNHQFSILITEDSKRPGQYLAWSRCKENNLCVLDAKTGQLIQKVELPGTFTSVPFAYKDKIYISLDKEDGLVILQ